MLHDEEVDAVLLADVVNVQMCGWFERRDGSRLAFEALTQIGVAGVLGTEHLDGDRPTEARVAGSVHLPHAA